MDFFLKKLIIYILVFMKHSVMNENVYFLWSPNIIYIGIQVMDL